MGVTFWNRATVFVSCVNECVGLCVCVYVGAVAEAAVSLPGVSGAGHRWRDITAAH